MSAGDSTGKLTQSWKRVYIWSITVRQKVPKPLIQKDVVREDVQKDSLVYQRALGEYVNFAAYRFHLFNLSLTCKALSEYGFTWVKYGSLCQNIDPVLHTLTGSNSPGF